MYTLQPDVTWHGITWRDVRWHDFTWHYMNWLDVKWRDEQSWFSFFKCLLSNLYFVSLLTFSFHEASKGLIPRGNFLAIRHIARMMVTGHKRIFGIAHDINIARLRSSIVAFGNHVILKMSFKNTGGRKAGKHFLYWLHVVHGIGIRFERQNHSFDERHSFIQPALTNFTIVKYLPYYFLGPCWTCRDTFS